MIIQHNMPAYNALRQTGINNHSTTRNLEKLSSGLKINRSADDAAGLGISEGMRGQIRGMGMAAQNSNNGISLIQTAEGGLNETHALLQRMRELAVQSSNGTYTDDIDRESLNKELQALKSEINRIASSTNYNGINVLDGSLGGTKMADLPGVATPVNLSYQPGSIGALGAYLKDLGFAINIDPGTASCEVGGTIALDSYNSLFDGQSANIILSNGIPSLQVGDKTYTSIYQDSPATYDVDGLPITVPQYRYAFVDENNNLVAVLNANTDEITGDKSGVIKNIMLGSAPSNNSIIGNQLDAGNTFPNSNHPMYNAILSNNTSKLIFQIGANGSADQQVGLHVGNMSSAGLGSLTATPYNPSGSVAGIAINPRDAANDALNIIDSAINQVSGTRADLGALQNRLEHTVNNLGVTIENLTAAESSIRDVDMAKEMMDFTKNNILVQASQSMLAQANQLPQGVLQLLK